MKLTKKATTKIAGKKKQIRSEHLIHFSGQITMRFLN